MRARPAPPPAALARVGRSVVACARAGSGALSAASGGGVLTATGACSARGRAPNHYMILFIINQQVGYFDEAESLSS